MNYTKMSLDERLKRAAAGYLTSPQFSRKIIDDFCNTPIIPILECLGAYKECKTLCEIMKNKRLNEIYESNCTDNPTFYDVAFIITRHYLKYGATPPDSLKSMTNKIQKLISIYFICFDAISQFHQKIVPFRRKAVPPLLLSVLDFLQVSFDDYYNYIEESVEDYSECDCSICVDKICDLREEMGLYPNISLLKIYDEFKDSIWGSDNYNFNIGQYTLPMLKDCENLCDFFAMPIAIIASINKMSTKGEN
ncbi:MAG: hypothetical protein J1F37_06560 [Oscillospiraceae bacterium]|nr:hypothetical protein [Oscillospiraceae bacterium]